MFIIFSRNKLIMFLSRCRRVMLHSIPPTTDSMLTDAIATTCLHSCRDHMFIQKKEVKPAHPVHQPKRTCSIQAYITVRCWWYSIGYHEDWPELWSVAEVMDGYCQTRRNLGCQQSNLFRKRSQNAYLGTNKQLNVPHHSSPNKRLYSLSVPSGSAAGQLIPTLHFLESVSTTVLKINIRIHLLLIKSKHVYLIMYIDKYLCMLSADALISINEV